MFWCIFHETELLFAKFAVFFVYFCNCLTVSGILEINCKFVEIREMCDAPQRNAQTSRKFLETCRAIRANTLYQFYTDSRGKRLKKAGGKHAKLVSRELINRESILTSIDVFSIFWS